MSRWKACAIHISISLTIFIGLLGVILFLWYPGILFTIDGGFQGLRLVIGVDLIAGPLLTLIIFKSGKPGLVFDLCCIAFFQATCMAAGMWVVYTERPLALVLAYDTFYSVDVKEFQQYERDPQSLEEIPGPYPKPVYVELPESDIAAEIAAIRAQFIGDPLYIQTEKYRARPAGAEELRGVFREETTARREVSEAVLNQIDESCLLTRFISSGGSGYVCFDIQSRTVNKYFENDFAPMEVVEE